MFDAELHKPGLFTSGLFNDGLLGSTAFDGLKRLTHPMVVATKGNDPSITGRYPQPANCVTFDGSTQYISASHLTGSETVVNDYGSTAAPTVSAGRIDFTAGNCYGVELSDGTYYDCGESSGTILLDRNDNANPGTLMGGVRVIDPAMLWQADVTNEEGYTLGTGSNGAAVGVIIPPSTIDPTKDCLGNNLQFSGSVYPVIPVPEGSSALRFDAALANYLPTGIVPNENTKLTVIARWHNISTVVGDFMGAGKDTESKAFLFGVNASDTSEWYASYYSANGVTGIPTDTEWHQFVLESNGDSATFSVDEVSVNLPAGVKAVFNDEICIAARDTSTGITSFADAEVSYVKIEQDGLVVFESGCTETSGTTVFDTSGNGNHGTLVNGPTWVNTRDGYGTNLNQLRGFSGWTYFNTTGAVITSAPTNGNQTVFRVEAEVFVDRLGINQVVCSSGNSNMRIIALSSNVWSFGGRTTSEPVTLGYHTVAFSSDGVDEFCYVDGLLVASGTITVSDGTVNNFQIGRRTSGLNWGGDIRNVKLNLTGDDDNWDHYWPLGTYEGVDVIGDFDGSLSGSPTIKRIPPLASDPTVDARDGLPLTNPVDPNLGIAKGAENTSNVYEVTELGDHTAATIELSGGAAIADGDTKASVLTLTNNRVFKNDTTNEIVAFQDTLTGDDFDKADSYTE